MITIHEVEQGTEKWKNLRDNLYTGQNADKLLSHSGKLKVIDGVVSAYALTEITGFSGNFYTKRGHILEDQAIDLYRKINKCDVSVSPEAGFVTNSKFPTCGYSPDGLRVDRTIECKAFNKDKHMKMFKGDIPLKVLAQCHFGMLICGKKICDLVIYNPDFAKKLLEDGSVNPDYNPKYAIKIITIRWNPSIAKNFKNKLSPKLVTA